MSLFKIKVGSYLDLQQYNTLLFIEIMKKISIIIVLFATLFACKNQDVDFPDFDYTAAYFPRQYPVRTLVLGNDIYDNTNDNNHKFLISARFGGVYKNTKDRILKIRLDESLCQNVKFKASSEPIFAMPREYYTLSSNDHLIIPAGEFYGSIEVQLTEAFFNDPLAIKLGYVIPLRIVSTNDVDSILRGRLLFQIPNPDCRIANQWEITPKDFTMFAVKFVNPYHGHYLHRGVSVVNNNEGQVLETVSYRTTYIEQNEIWKLVTTGKNQVSIKENTHSSKFTGGLNLLLNFTENGSCTVSGISSIKTNTNATIDYPITGNGTFINDGDAWGGSKRDAIHLKYQFTDGVNTFSATDTLVIRDRGIVMEVFEPVVTK
ncbi:MAG: DUF5627 domain-containing protein [Petrimonas sp.]|jgi:hypothetical protein